MRGYIFLGKFALVDQGLDERVINGDLLQLVVAHHVSAGVAHVAQRQLLAVKHDGSESRAHAVGFRGVAHSAGNSAVGVIGDGGEHGQHVVVARVTVQVLEVADHHLGGDLTSRVAAHSVG